MTKNTSTLIDKCMHADSVASPSAQREPFFNSSANESTSAHIDECVIADSPREAMNPLNAAASSCIMPPKHSEATKNDASSHYRLGISSWESLSFNITIK